MHLVQVSGPTNRFFGNQEGKIGSSVVIIPECALSIAPSRYFQSILPILAFCATSVSDGIFSKLPSAQSSNHNHPTFSLRCISKRRHSPMIRQNAVTEKITRSRRAAVNQQFQQPLAMHPCPQDNHCLPRGCP